MTTTVQQIVDRALARHVANDASLVPSTAAVLHRINTDLQSIFNAVAEENRTYFQDTVTLNSTNASSARTVDISDSALTAATKPPVERILKVTLPSAQEIYKVDLQDLDAEITPRYFQRGTKLVEVGTDWGFAGVIAVTIDYVSRPADLDLAGAYTQSISGLPDRFTDLLDNRLARWLAAKDVGRDTGTEFADLDADYEKRLMDLMAFLDHFSGVETRRTEIPRPQPQS